MSCHLFIISNIYVWSFLQNDVFTLFYHLMMRTFHNFHLHLHLPFPFHFSCLLKNNFSKQTKRTARARSAAQKMERGGLTQKVTSKIFYQNLFTICAHPKMVMDDIVQCFCRIVDHKQWRYTKQINQKHCCCVLRPKFSFFFFTTNVFMDRCRDKTNAVPEHFVVPIDIC